MPVRHVLTILAVADLGHATAFCRDAFGWAQVVETASYAELALPAGMRLGLYARDGFARNTGRSAAPPTPGHTSATELYLHVDDLDQLDAAIAALRRTGAVELSGRAPRAWGDVAAYFADPDGNVVVVATPAAAT